jgi:hypothetical protein
MRSRGATLQAIADRLGFTREGARKICDRVEERESRHFSKHIHRVKARQNGQLETIISEGFGSWAKSNEPRRRAVRKEGLGDGGEIVESTEAVDQCGDPRYLHLVLAAQESQRELLGLNIAAAENPYHPTTLAEVVKSWKAPDELDNPEPPEAT